MLGDPVAADAVVDEGQVPFGQFVTMHGGDDELVAVAEDVVGVEVSSPVAVGNGVALEKNARPLGERGHGVFCRTAIDRAAGWQHQQGQRDQSPLEHNTSYFVRLTRSSAAPCGARRILNS